MRQMRVVLADDHRLMLQVMRLALEDAGEFTVVAEARSGSELLPLVARLQPDLVLLDIEMPEMDGLTALRLLRKRHPEIKVVMISGIEDPKMITASAQGGAAAFIAKTIDPDELAPALRQAAAGPAFQALGVPAEADATVAKEAGLSKRELGILRALASGLSNKQIAKELWLAEQTVKFHLTNIYRKLGVDNRTDAVRYAYRHSLVESPMLEARQQRRR